MDQRKTAQERKLRHKVRRLVNPTGAALSALSPTFKKVIKDLDRTDKKVRKEAEDLNYYIGMAKSFARRRDYITAATYLAKFHEKAKSIHHQLNEFNTNRSIKTRRFLLQQSKGKDKSHLFGYDPSKKIEEVKKVDDGINLLDDGFVSTAGAIKDWWRTPSRFSDLSHALTDRKSRAMKALESNFSDTIIAQLKQDTKEMLAITNDFYKGLLENFHRMGYAWGARNVSAYDAEIKDINEAYKPYNEAYLKYHENNIVPLKEEQEKINKEDEELRALNKQREDAKPKQEFETVSDPFPQLPSESKPSVQEPISSSKPSSVYEPVSSSELSSVYEPVSSMDVEPATLSRSKPDTARFPYFTSDSPWNQPKSVQSPATIPVPNPVPPPAIPKEERHRQIIQKEMDERIRKDREYADQRRMEREKGADEDFINRIQKLSSEKDIISEILAYSEEVEKYSAEDSLKLLAVAEGMIEKSSGIFDRIKKNLNKPEESPETPKIEDLEEKRELLKKEPPKKEVEVIEKPIFVKPPTPGKKRKPSQLEVKKDEDILANLMPGSLKPVEHGIPEGIVQKRWHEIPFLAKKTDKDIKLSSETANLIINTIGKHLHHKYVPYKEISDFEIKLVDAVKKSIVKGQVISNMSCSDEHNTRDCSLEVFCYIRLSDIDPSQVFQDLVLSFNAVCRLAIFGGAITVRKITNPKLHNVQK